MTRLLRLGAQGLIALMVGMASVQAANPETLLETICTVDKEGHGHREAVRAMRELTQLNAAVLPAILETFDSANPLAANWLRGVFETIADRAIQEKSALPAKELEQFVRDRRQNAQARRLAYEWLIKVDPTLPDRIIPGMLHDPSPEFRREAVARLIAQAKELQKDEPHRDEAIAVYRKALSGATDNDQVKAISKALRTLGEQVDLQKHFGFLAHWHVIGPFDNRDNRGFAASYPPEREFDPSARYEGLRGAVQWKPLATKHEYGIVDFAELLETYSGVAMYAAAEFFSSAEQSVEIRLGTPNAWKLWVNGEELFGRDEYHRGMAVDQYRVAARLKPGRNIVLLKVCQNEQTEDWAQRFRYQLRICDPSGVAIRSQEVAATSPESAPSRPTASPKAQGVRP